MPAGTSDLAGARPPQPRGRDHTEAALHRQVQYLQTLSDLAQALGRTVDLRQICQMVVERVAATTGALRCVVLRHLPDTDDYLYEAVWWRGTLDPTAPSRRIAGRLAAQALRARAPVVVQDTRDSDDPAIRERREGGILSVAAMPIILGDRLWGALIAGYLLPNALMPDRVDYLKAMTAHLAVAVANSEMVAALRASERRFRAVVEYSHDGIMLLTADGSLQYAGPASCRIVDLTNRDAVASDVFQAVHADDRPRLRQRLAELVQQPGGTLWEEFRTQREDGAAQWIEASATNLLHDPAIGAIVVNFRDVTERKRADAVLRESARQLRAQAEHLRTLNAFAGTVTRSLDLRSVLHLMVGEVLRLVGGARCAILEYDVRTGSLQLRAVRCRDGAEDAPEGVSLLSHGTAVEAVIRRQQPHVVPRLQQDTVDPVSRPFLAGLASLAAVPVFAGGALWGVLTVAFEQPDAATPERVDLLTGIAGYLGVAIHNARLYSELRAAHEALKATQEQIVEQERLRALGQMASGIAHDFNNALALIVGFSELLLEVPGHLEDREKARHFLRLIRTGAQDAASVVRRLREFYRPREADETLSMVELPRLIAEVVSLTQPRWKDQAQAEGRTIHVEIDCAPVLPIAGRETELREALTNLVFNAVDAMPQGGRLTLRTRPQADRVLLEVADTGTGMSSEVRRRCLEPFFSTKGAGGSGLGLPMVYGIVQRHGGQLDIESEPGRGTTVRIELPVRADGSSNGIPEEFAPGPRLQVLVVDDEPLVRKVTADLLTTDGHTVVEAANGTEALARCQANQFDLVITDRAMPGMNGDELARVLKAMAPATPIILLTGFGDLMETSGVLPAGVDVVVGKPVTGARLRRVVAAITGRNEGSAT